MVRFSYYSIKLQILVAFSLLVLPVIALAYFFSLSHQVFQKSLNELMVVEDLSATLAEVERDVIDLQRNALIFRETASASASEKVTYYHASILDKLTRLENSKDISLQQDSVRLMNSHLSDYYSNFQTVSELRNQRSALIERHLNVEALLKALQPDGGHSVQLVALEFLSAHNASLSYLDRYAPSDLDVFTKNIDVAKNILAQANSEQEKLKPAALLIEQYEKRFSRVVSITRHYVYLTNVVMTGSANEIIYYAKFLHDEFIEHANETRTQVARSLEIQRLWISVVSLIGIVVAGFAAMLFYIRITHPIERITRVFQQLAAEEAVEDIPEIQRKDEIGSLALAADVFRTKNAQTNRLLDDTKRMVNEQKALNAKLVVETKRAEQAHAVKSEFLANMSHELRTPLNSIIGFTVRLQKMSRLEPEKEQKALNAIERNGRHLLAMINDILDLSKIEAQKLEIRIGKVNLDKLCAEVAAQLTPSAEEKGLELIYNPTEVPVVETDQTRMSQILINLLSNAVKYTEQGSIKLELDAGFNDRCVNVRVVDTGIGISAEDQKRIFRRFEQFDENSRFQVGKGTGLGLAIVASVSKLLGAQVTVSSVVDQGSTFSVRVPLTFDAEQ